MGTLTATYTGDQMVGNREEWLAHLTVLVAPWFEALGHPVPDTVRASCGFPSRSGLSARRRRLGECWDGEVSRGGHREIFISPVLDDPVEVAQVLVHELLHAALPAGVGHRAPFPRLARQLGLEGKPSATIPGDDFRRRIGPLLAEVGRYPHVRLEPAARPVRASRPPLRAMCTACGYAVRVTRKWLEAVGAPICPCAEGGIMEIPAAAEG